MNITPLHNNVLVKVDGCPEKIGSIIIPQSHNYEAKFGTVLATGPGKWIEKEKYYRPTPLKAGQRVLFNHFAGHPIEKDGVEYLLLTDNEIWGVVEE